MAVIAFGDLEPDDLIVVGAPSSVDATPDPTRLPDWFTTVGGVPGLSKLDALARVQNSTGAVTVVHGTGAPDGSVPTDAVYIDGATGDVYKDS